MIAGLTSCQSEKGLGEDGPSYASYQIEFLNNGDDKVRAVISYDDKEIIETSHIESTASFDSTDGFILFIPSSVEVFEVELTILSEEIETLSQSINIKDFDSDILLIKYDGAELTINPVYEVAE